MYAHGLVIILLIVTQLAESNLIRKGIRLLSQRNKRNQLDEKFTRFLVEMHVKPDVRMDIKKPEGVKEILDAALEAIVGDAGEIEFGKIFSGRPACLELEQKKTFFMIWPENRPAFMALIVLIGAYLGENGEILSWKNSMQIIVEISNILEEQGKFPTGPTTYEAAANLKDALYTHAIWMGKIYLADRLAAMLSVTPKIRRQMAQRPNELRRTFYEYVDGNAWRLHSAWKKDKELWQRDREIPKIVPGDGVLTEMDRKTDIFTDYQKKLDDWRQTKEIYTFRVKEAEERLARIQAKIREYDDGKGRLGKRSLKRLRMDFDDTKLEIAGLKRMLSSSDYKVANHPRINFREVKSAIEDMDKSDLGAAHSMLSLVYKIHHDYPVKGSERSRLYAARLLHFVERRRQK